MRTNPTLVTILGLVVSLAAACAQDDGSKGLLDNTGARGGDAGRDLGSWDQGPGGPDTAVGADTGWDPVTDLGPSYDVTDPGDGGSSDSGPDEPNGPDTDQPPPPDESEGDPIDEEPLDPGLLGFIGSACQSEADCDFDGALCLREGDGYPLGMCTRPCDRLCPDRAGYPVTFCTQGADDAGAVCHSRCDFAAYPGTGCRDGYACDERPRAGEPATVVGTCVPADGASVVLSHCLRWLADRGIPFEPTTYAPRSPAGRPDLTCEIEDPIRLHSPVNGINFRYYYDDPGDFRPLLMSCKLAQATYDMTQVLQEWEVTEVVHVGTTVCRTMSSGDLSQHALGLAIDLAGFFDAGANWYGVEDHWEHDNEDPVTTEGQMLWDFVQALVAEWIFNIILTPNYNSAHDNHFHVDLTQGARFWMLVGEDFGPYLGVNPDNE